MRAMAARVEQAYEAARQSHQARGGPHRDHHLHHLHQRRVIDPVGRLRATCWSGYHHARAGSASSCSMRLFAAAGLGQLSEVWGELSAASGAAERLFEILRVKLEIAAPASPRALPAAGARRCRLRQCQLCLSDAAGCARGRWRLAVGARRREGRDRRALGRRQEHAVSPAAALLRSGLRHCISFDGVPIRTADPHELRARIALVPQDSVVFAATARENIRFGRPDASDAEVERAADLAHATEFIRRLPDGF